MQWVSLHLCVVDFVPILWYVMVVAVDVLSVLAALGMGPLVS